MRFRVPDAVLVQLQESGGMLPEVDFGLFVEGAFGGALQDVVGVGVVPLAASNLVELRFLSRHATALTYREGTTTWDGAGLLPAALEPQPVAGLPPDIDSTSFYQFSPATGYAYLSVKDGTGGYLVYRWDHASYAAQTLPMTRRVEAALSTGRLFARSDANGYIYSPSGSRLVEFPMGALEFAGEYWNAPEGRFRMVFALPMLSGGGDEEPQSLTVEVYSLPTDEVGRLE
jgi:hypothetical protein